MGLLDDWREKYGEELTMLEVFLDWADADESIQHNEEVAKYNRMVDRYQVAAYLKRNEDDMAITSRQIADAGYERDTATMGVAFAQEQARNEQFRREYITDLAETEAHFTREIAAREYFVQDAGIRVREAQLAGEGHIDEARSHLLDVQARGAEDVYQEGRRVRMFDRAAVEAGFATRQAQRRLVGMQGEMGEVAFQRGQVARAEQRRLADTREAVGRRELQGRRRVFGARSAELRAERIGVERTAATALGAVGTRRAATLGAGAIARGERREAGYRTAGAAVAGEAARGFVGSASAVGMAEEQFALDRDLALQKMEEQTALTDMLHQETALIQKLYTDRAGLDTRLTELDLERAAAEGQYRILGSELDLQRRRLDEEEAERRFTYGTAKDRSEVELARLAEGDARGAAQRARIGEEEVRAFAGHREGWAARQVGRTELRARATTRPLMQAQARLERNLAYSRREQGEAQARLRAHRGLVEVRDSVERQTSADLRAREGQAQVHGYNTRIDSLQREQDQQAANQAFAEWQLENQPGLPAYGRMRVTNAVTALLNLARED